VASGPEPARDRRSPTPSTCLRRAIGRTTTLASLPTRAGATLMALLVAACASGPPSAAPTGGAPASTPPTAQATVPPASATATASVATSRPSAGPSPVRDPGTSRTDAKEIRQVWVPGGGFTMGSDAGSATPPDWAANTFASEHPAHRVTLARGYWIDETEVTVAAFAAFKAAGGYTTRANWTADGWAWLEGMGSVPLPLPCVAQQPDQPQVCVS
jgi:formylglycine-generating enzyme required for sulfatase activity